MKNTSMGYHTFSYFQRLNEEGYSSLESDFIRYMNEVGNIKRIPVKNTRNPKIIIGWEYIYHDGKGIRWLLLSINISPWVC